MLFSRMILVVSPTLNNGLLPTVDAFLTYVKGLRPRNRIGFAFGSYGWGGQAVGEIEKVMKDIGWEMPLESINIKYIPNLDELEHIKGMGTRLAGHLVP